MGHILTWLVQVPQGNGRFLLQTAAEAAYSRLRGVDCQIKPKNGLNAVFWIEQMSDEEGEPIPHLESMTGPFDYSGEIDYSDDSDLTDYALSDRGKAILGQQLVWIECTEYCPYDTSDH